MAPRSNVVPVTRVRAEDAQSVSLEVTGPMSLLRDPVLRKVKKSQKLKNVLGKFLERKKLEGYRATRVKGSARDSVGLEVTVKQFIDTCFKRPPPVIRMRLVKPRGGALEESRPVPEVVIIDDEEDDVVVMDDVTITLEEIKTEGEMEKGQTKQSQQAVVGDSPEKPVEVAASAASSVVSVTLSPPLPPQPPRVTPTPVEEQEAGSSRSMMEEERARQERRRERRMAVPPPLPPPSSTSTLVTETKIVRVKRETVKQEIPEPPASIIADLRAKGVQIDNLKAQTQTRMKTFSNPFLLLVRQEIRDLQRRTLGSQVWESVVSKAPRCAYLVNELFKDEVGRRQ